MTELHYKHYIGDAHQLEDGTWWGRVVSPDNICCIYEGQTLEELKQDFRECVDELHQDN